MSTKIPAYAALVIHEVKSYDEWKPKFDGHEPLRRSFGILGHHINRSADNPNLLAVYLPDNDLKKLQAFLTDDGLRAAMKQAGVIGTPDIKLVQVRSVDADLSRPRAGMIVFHQVADYERWRAAYDAFDAERRELGITGHAVNTRIDDANAVIVYHQADSVETLRAFMSSDALKSRMAEAGVTGAPEVTFWNALPGAEY
jgi:G:T-mismatch repair DNA endonuclease (very short patch repair protein)